MITLITMTVVLTMRIIRTMAPKMVLSNSCFSVCELLQSSLASLGCCLSGGGGGGGQRLEVMYYYSDYLPHALF